MIEGEFFALQSRLSNCMNPNQTMQPSPQWLAAMAGRGYSSAGKKANRVTIGGVWLFLIGCAIFLSGIAAFRGRVFNLRVQPFLIPVVAALPLVLTRLPKFPIKVLAGFLAFATLYALSLVLHQSAQKVSPMEETLKLTAAIGVVITVALLVSSRADFVLGSWGFCLAIGALALRGVEEEQENIIDVANKNSYSMYALPAVLLAIYIALRVDWKKVSFRKVAVFFMALCSLGSVVAIYAGANRSGYLGVVLIVLMTGFYTVFNPRFSLVRRSMRAMRLALLVVAVVAGVVYKGTEILEHRLEQTEQGTDSDRQRVELFVESLKIGMAHPILGVSPQVLPVLLAERLFPDQSPGAGYETHNVFAHVIGGCGFITMFALIYTAWKLFFLRPPGNRQSSDADADFYDARTLLRMMIILWGVRGMFSQEILYNPGFCVGLGLAIGLCMVELDLIKKSVPSGYPAMVQMIPSTAMQP
jgi:hypothetical protein